MHPGRKPSSTEASLPAYRFNQTPERQRESKGVWRASSQIMQSSKASLFPGFMWTVLQPGVRC